MTAHSIGTEKESNLHRSLKFTYAGAGGQTEIPLGAYVADGVSREGEIIEVQTGSFGPLKRKIKDLMARGPVKIIHPIIIKKFIEVFDRGGTLLYTRKSPRKGSEWDLFKALLYAPELALAPGLTIELALTDILEKRVLDGKGSWRRKGASIADRELLACRGTITLNSPEDYRRFIPFAEEETFTVKDLKEKARIPRPLAGKTLYVLTKMGLLNRTGKQGNAWKYKLLTYQASDISSESRLSSAKRSVTARRSSK
jgi:hypothetical protein